MRQETIQLSLYASKTSKETTQIYKTLLASLRLRCMVRVLYDLRLMVLYKVVLLSDAVVNKPFSFI